MYTKNEELPGSPPPLPLPAPPPPPPIKAHQLIFELQSFSIELGCNHTTSFHWQALKHEKTNDKF
jgi:hypothetical protein